MKCNDSICFIECRGCWRLRVLGISNREITEVVTRKDQVEAIITRPLPAHGKEVCPDCGLEFEFPPLDARPPADNEEFTFVTFRFGPYAWPERAEENYRCLPTKSFNTLSSRW